jgi:hypothetical protein
VDIGAAKGRPVSEGGEGVEVDAWILYLGRVGLTKHQLRHSEAMLKGVSFF